jgi:hypothetical protein
MKAVGADVEGGRLYVCTMEPARSDGQFGAPIPSANRRFEMNSRLREAARLADLAERLGQYLEPLGVDCVVLSEVRRYGQWKYRDAYAHVLTIAALMVASHELAIEFETVTTEKIAKTVNVPASRLETVDFAKFGYDARPKYWTAGLGEAHAAAAYAVGAEQA